MSRSKNNEIKNVLLRTVIKLYEGSYPTQNVKLAHKAKKVLGSRFLSIEKDDDSIIEPLVRRNLDDFYKSANGVEIIDFSKSSTFFPSRTESFYSFERVAEMAKNSPYVTLEDFFDYVKTRPDKEKFASWLWYTASEEYEEMGFHKFFGLDTLESMKENLLNDIEKIVQKSLKKGYKQLYVRREISKLINPYSPDQPEYDPSLFNGVKGGVISNTANGIRHMYQGKFGKIKDRIESYASQEKFEEYCKKFNVKKKIDLHTENDSEEKMQFALKYGIVRGIDPMGIYPTEFVSGIFTETNKYINKGIDLDMCIKMQKDLNSGMLLKDVATKYGISQQSVSKSLKERGLDYKSKNDVLKSVDPNTVEKLIKEGKDLRGIAKELRVSPQTINRVIKKNNIPYRRGDINILNVEEIKKLTDEGFTYSKIAETKGINQVTVSRFCKENGILGKRIKSSPKLSPLSEDEIDYIITLVKSGLSLSQISIQVGRNRKIIKSIIIKKEIEYNPKTGPKLKI